MQHRASGGALAVGVRKVLSLLQKRRKIVGMNEFGGRQRRDSPLVADSVLTS